jgi:hypothetical protein
MRNGQFQELINARLVPNGTVIVNRGGQETQNIGMREDMVSYWLLEEESGTRYDSRGSNDLTDHNTVTSVTGKVGMSARFTRVNTEWLSVEDNATLQVGAFDWTLTAWAYTTAIADRGIVSRHNGSNTASSYIMWLPNGTNAAFSTISGTTLTTLQTSAGTFNINGWHFVACGWDETAKKSWLQVDNGTVVQSAVIGTPNAGSRPVEIGRRSEGTPFCWDGMIDEVGFWKRKLTPTEIATLYNSGSGIAYSLITGQVSGFPELLFDAGDIGA